ncbi:MAG: hypothetical protein KAS19_11320 [Anaerolineales bacterium]|nr:hypothetical protein [Anaerolineales bacterium]
MHWQECSYFLESRRSIDSRVAVSTVIDVIVAFDWGTLQGYDEIVREHHRELTVEIVSGEHTRFHTDLLVNNGWTFKKNKDAKD